MLQGKNNGGWENFSYILLYKIFFGEATGREPNHSESNEQAVQLHCSKLIIERS